MKEQRQAGLRLLRAGKARGETEPPFARMEEGKAWVGRQYSWLDRSVEEGAEEVTRNQEERLRGQCRETAEEDRDRRLNEDSRHGSKHWLCKYGNPSSGPRTHKEPESGARHLSS